MPFRYIIKWRRTHPEKISVEAYHRYPHKEEEKHKPAFTIGKAEGGGLLAIRHLLEKATQTNPTSKRGNTTYILLTENDPAAYETAYRMGLAAALINKAQTPTEIQKGTRYILNATPEEIWFWTSKLLDDEINTKALEALAVISGSINLETLNNQAQHPTTKLSPNSKPKGSFWPIVRERMQQKAIQLYQKDHPDEYTPSLKELRKNGYLQAAKSAVLKEISSEKKHETQLKITQNNAK